MQMRLTRKLIFAFLIGSGLVPVANVSAEPAAGLSSTEQANYLHELKRLYNTQDERKALLAHVNKLLLTYALRAGYQVGQADRNDLIYSVALGAQGELLLREETRGENSSDIAVRNQRIDVFGVDPFIRYDCPTSGISCSLNNPVTGNKMITIVRDNNGAADLAKAMSYLIRNVQKG
ncbi:hypothetical protein [Pseudomonas sp. M30-35]|uniref:hypothetical protein n=1 Tax=Pseudomonas sp. M30-35 TaxID=1981174 RepID=UPI000B3D36F1|nr:hypothetical protein [Pseudomonas sp. M30-35]ARU90068.1 hypothetical protein B9K09_19860 [Pseudomonas sp. M30-35]